MTAARHISSIGGGLTVALDSEVIASLPLPIAGLISDMPIESVILSLEAHNGACLKLGSNVIKDPFMLLSFLALPVIPSLKLTDKGLVDVDKFQFTDLWINHRYSDKIDHTISGRLGTFMDRLEYFNWCLLNSVRYVRFPRQHFS